MPLAMKFLQDYKKLRPDYDQLSNEHSTLQQVINMVPLAASPEYSSPSTFQAEIRLKLNEIDIERTMLLENKL